LRWFGRMRSPERIRRILSLGALASGCFMAFSFGTNNAGNVAAPLVGAGFWSPGAGALISGLFLGAGALVLGGRLLGTTREIHTLCSIKAGVLTIIAAALVIGASAAGIPVPLVQIVPAGAMGMTCCQSGLRETAGKEVVRRILRTWALSPVVSMGIVLAGLHLAGAGAGVV
ncbi:MAG: inorganic phosphate transporter, partial [Firmicutes bacterium]|nr:inorganic phosphate transporter [Bacillota bacterium]